MAVASSFCASSMLPHSSRIRRNVSDSGVPKAKAGESSFAGPESRQATASPASFMPESTPMNPGQVTEAKACRFAGRQTTTMTMRSREPYEGTSKLRPKSVSRPALCSGSTRKAEHRPKHRNSTNVLATVSESISSCLHLAFAKAVRSSRWNRSGASFIRLRLPWTTSGQRNPPP